MRTMYVDYARRCALIRNKKLKNLQVILKHTVTHGHDNKRRKIEGFVYKNLLKVLSKHFQALQCKLQIFHFPPL